MHRRTRLLAFAACALAACSWTALASPDAGEIQPPVLPNRLAPATSCGPMPSAIPEELKAVPKGQRLSVKLRLTISPAGEVSNVRVFETSNNSAFDWWAIRSVAAWRCPVSQRTTDVEAEIPLSFMAD